MTIKDENEKLNIFELQKRINKEAKNCESLNTGLVGEHIIVSAYNQMSIEKLEKMRFVINHLIKKKKELKRVNQ